MLWRKDFQNFVTYSTLKLTITDKLKAGSCSDRNNKESINNQGST